MRFAIPSLLWLLLLVPLLGFFLVWALGHRRELLSRFATAQVLTRGNFMRNAAVLWLRTALLLLAFIMLIFALARPQWGFHERQVITQGVDMMIAIDTSASMMARDYPPSRLERAKDLLRNLIWEARGERVGVVAFAGSAAIMCPLTLDYNMAATALKAVDMNTVAARGTDIGAAINSAIGAFEVSGANDRVLVLLTDGEQLERQDQLEAAIARAKKEGVHIFAIGLGTPDGSTIPTLRGPLRDATGNVVKTKLDFELLQRIAKETDGQAIRAEKIGASEIAQISAQLAKFRGRKQQDKTYRVYHERYPLFVGAALLFLVLEALLRGSRGIRTRLGNRKNAQAAAVVLGAALTGYVSTAAAYPGETFVTARDAMQNYQTRKYDKAAEEYQEASALDPQNPLLTYNLGVATAKAGQTSAAMSLLGKVYDPEKPNLNVKARYGVATLNHREMRKEIADSKEAWARDLAAGKPEAKSAVQAMIERLNGVISEYQQVILAEPDDTDMKVNFELAKRDKAELEKLLKDNEQQQQQQQQQQQENQQEKKDQQEQGGKQDQKDQQSQQQQGKSGDEKNKQQQQQSQEDQQKKDQQDQQKDQQQNSGDQQKQDQKNNGEKQDQKQGDQKQDNSQDNKPGDQQGQQQKPDQKGTPTPTPAPQGTPSQTPAPSPTPSPTGTPASGKPEEGEGQAGSGKGQPVPIGQMSPTDVDRLLNTLPPENQQALQLMMGAPTEQQDMKHEW